jgi:hypothetical protein
MPEQYVLLVPARDVGQERLRKNVGEIVYPLEFRPLFNNGEFGDDSHFNSKLSSRKLDISDIFRFAPYILGTREPLTDEQGKRLAGAGYFVYQLKHTGVSLFIEEDVSGKYRP